MLIKKIIKLHSLKNPTRQSALVQMSYNKIGFSMKHKFILPFAIVSIVQCVNVSAGVIEFLDDGIIKKVHPSSITYLKDSNPKVIITAGLDRIIKIQVRDNSNRVISEIVTSKISIEDRIKTSTGEAYGKILPLSLSTGDGDYSLHFSMLGLEGDEIDTENHNLLLDSIPPTSDKFSWSFPYGTGTGLSTTGFPIWSPINAKLVKISNVIDSGSGISEAWFEMRYRGGEKDGQIYSTGPLDYLRDHDALVLGTGSASSINKSYFVAEKVDSTFLAFVKDKAGNIHTTQQNFHLNGRCGSKPTLYAYQDSSVTTSVAGQENMRFASSRNHITSNPLNLIYRVPKNEAKINNSIYGGFPHGISYQWLENDDKYAYLLIKNASVGYDSRVFWPDVGHSDLYTWRCHPYEMPNLTFSTDAKPPKFKKYQAYINGPGWVDSGYSPYTTRGYSVPRNSTLVHLKAIVEPRNYNQVIIDGSTTLCSIPSGASECTYTPNWPFNTEGKSDHYHRRPNLIKEGTSLKAATSYIFKYDGTDPIINGLDNHDEINRTLDFTVTKLHTGNTWGEVKLNEAGIKFIDRSSNSVVQTIQGDISGSGNINYVKVDYSKFKAEGSYDIEAYAIDNGKNQSKLNLVSNHILDTKSPIIHMEVNNVMFEQDQLVKGLESIMVILNDASEPRVSSMILTGGPSHDKVELAYVDLGNGKFKVEYPRLFPSAKEGSYTLTVVAEDKYAQSSIASFKFLYEPNNLIKLEAITYLPTDVQLFTSEDKPFATIKSNSLRTDNGNIASGEQELVVTVREDSESSLVIAGEVIRPGETKIIPHTIANIDGRLEIPIMPSGFNENATANMTHFMVEILTIK